MFAGWWWWTWRSTLRTSRGWRASRGSTWTWLRSGSRRGDGGWNPDLQNWPYLSSYGSLTPGGRWWAGWGWKRPKGTKNASMGEEQQRTGASETVQKRTAPGEKLLPPHRSVCNSIENKEVNYYCFSGRAGCGLFLWNLGVIYFSFSGNILYCVRLFPPAVCNAGADRIFINTACSAG